MQLRKILNTLLFALIAMCLVFSLVGCGDGAGGKDNKPDSPTNGEGELKGSHTIYLIDKPDGVWNVWAWKDTDTVDTNYDSKGWPGGTYQLTGNDEIGAFTKMDLDTSARLGILFVKSTGSPQTADIIVPQDVIANYTTLYFIYGDSNYYTSLEDLNGIKSAQLTATDTIEATIRGVTSVTASDFTVKDSSGTAITVSSASISGSKATIKISGADISKSPFSVTYNDITVSAAPTSELIDGNFVYTANDTAPLGLTIDSSSITFRTWAPLASDVKLLIYENAAAVTSKTISGDPIQMEKGESGTWFYKSSDMTLADGKHYYKYRITNSSQTNDVADIWSYAASPDSVASQIVDINDGWEAYHNPFTGKYTDAVIYEMHVRDWAKAFGGEGKFDELTKELGDTGKFAQHLKDLGITHVQILPAFDYAQPNSDEKYNWGYNPYHYNVPEGRYVKDMVDGTDAVNQFRDLIKAFHDQGIAVIMDVVYNHTAGTGINSLYDMTVPEYFYRLNTDGGYSNGSGCGNEVATNHKMVAKFVIESLKHWMNDYHINGFRFDLMGCHEQDFMKEVYETLYEIDNNVMVYGEPWQGGTAQTKNPTDKTISTTKGFGVGAFEDTFRNGIKGGEFGGFQAGHVQGTYKDNDIINGLLGKSGRNSSNGTSKPGLMLCYVECHDNYTLYDKLAISQFSFSGKNDAQLKTLWKKFEALDTTKQKAVSAQNKLAAAYVFLSQGTPFINGGQEFMRDKKGDHNSYQSDDTINGIDLGYKETHKDVYNVYKGLIALRKANSSAFGGNTSATAEKVKEGVTKYTTGNFLVYFNATDSAEAITTTGYSKVIDVTSGTPTESTTLPTSVPAKSFVILAK